MRKRGDIDYLSDMVHIIEELESHSSDDLSELVLYRVIERCLEILGEASSKVSDEIKEEWPNVPWRVMKGTRNWIIHDYDRVNMRLLLNIIEHELPELKIQLKIILKKLKERP